MDVFDGMSFIHQRKLENACCGKFLCNPVGPEGNSVVETLALFLASRKGVCGLFLCVCLFCMLLPATVLVFWLHNARTTLNCSDVKLDLSLIELY